MYRSRATLYSYWWCYLHDHPTRMYITVTVNWLFQRSNIGLKLFTSPWVMASQKSMQQFSSEKDTTSKRSILVPWMLSYEFEVFLFRLSSSVPSWIIPLKMFVVCKRNISTLLIVHCINYYREVASTHGGWINRRGEYFGWVCSGGFEYSGVEYLGWVCPGESTQKWASRGGYVQNEYPRGGYSEMVSTRGMSTKEWVYIVVSTWGGYVQEDQYPRGEYSGHE